MPKQKQKKKSKEQKEKKLSDDFEEEQEELPDILAQQPEFPPRMFSKNDHPLPKKSITQFSTRRDLLDLASTALREDEWDELRNSHLGVLVKFYELKFGWASRLVHYMLCSQLWCQKPYEIWSLIGDQPMRFSLHEFHHITGLNCQYKELMEKPSVEITDEIKDFWELLDISVQTGPSYNDLLEACKKCSNWEREDRIKLGYLALYATFIEAQPKLDPTKAALAMTVIDPIESPRYPWGRLAHAILIKSVKKASVASGSYTIHGFIQVLHVWILYALPVFAKKFGEPLDKNPTPPLLAYRGSRGRRDLRKNMQKQTSVRHFIRKELVDMFPIWDTDVDDELVVNIVKAMYGEFGANWRWNDNHWPAMGVLENKTHGTAADADEEDEVEDMKNAKREIKAGMKVEDGPDERNPVDDLSYEMQDGFTNVLKLFKEGFVDLGIKLDILTKKVDVLTDDVSDLKIQVNGGGTDEKADVETGGEEPEVEKKEKGGGRKRKKETETGGEKKQGNKKRKVVDKEETEEQEEAENKEEAEHKEENEEKEEAVEEKEADVEKDNADGNAAAAADASNNQEKGNVEEASLVEIPENEVVVDFTKAKRAKLNAQEKAAQTVAAAKIQESKRQLILAPEQAVKQMKASTGHGYDPCKPIERTVLQSMNAYIKSQPGWPEREEGSVIKWYWTFRTTGKWLQDEHIDCGIDLLRLRHYQHPEWFRSARMCFLDTLLQRFWVGKYDEWKKHGFMPPGAYDYHNGVLPVFCKSGKVWGLDVDDIYSPLHVKGDHWVAMWISIPDRHITVWDCKPEHARENEIEEVVTPFMEIMPSLLNTVHGASENWRYPTTPFTYNRVTKGVPHNDRGGDCGVYCLKYIEFHALGMEFPEYLCDKNIRAMRDKLAGDTFHILKRNGQETRTGEEWALLDLYEPKTD